MSRMIGDCLQQTLLQWRKYKCDPNGRVCTGLLKVEGDFDYRCHFWYEIGEIAKSDMYDPVNDRRCVVDIPKHKMEEMYDNIRRYSNDTYQLFIDAIDELQTRGYVTYSHMQRVILLEYIDRGGLKPSNFTLKHTLELAKYLKFERSH